jgi:hypothetical protein
VLPEGEANQKVPGSSFAVRSSFLRQPWPRLYLLQIYRMQIDLSTRGDGFGDRFDPHWELLGFSFQI